MDYLPITIRLKAGIQYWDITNHASGWSLLATGLVWYIHPIPPVSISRFWYHHSWYPTGPDEVVGSGRHAFSTALHLHFCGLLLCGVVEGYLTSTWKLGEIIHWHEVKYNQSKILSCTSLSWAFQVMPWKCAPSVYRLHSSGWERTGFNSTLKTKWLWVLSLPICSNLAILHSSNQSW